MAKACAYKPGVKNREGKIVNSRLFDSLLAFFNKDRAESKKHYFIATHPDFIEAFREDLEFDDNSEVTLESYLKATNTNPSNLKFLAFINKEAGSGEYDADVAIGKAQEFNKGEYKKDYIPSLTWTKDGKVHFEIINRTAVAENNLQDFYKKQALFNKINNALRNNGVDVSFLESSNNTLKGRYSTLNPEKTYEGLYNLISIFSGDNVTETLAEEAGHFVFAAMGANPLVSRLQRALENEGVINQIFGNELSLYDKDQQIREAAGKLIAKALLNKTTPFESLLNRLVLSAKKLFSKFSKDSVKRLLVEAEILADKMADSFLSANFEGSVDNALDSKEELFSKTTSLEVEAFSEVKAQLEAYKRNMQRINYKCKNLYTKNVNKALSEATGRILTAKSDLAREQYAIKGMSETLILLINDYERIMGNLLKIDLSSKEINYRNVDQIKEARVYIDTAISMLSLVEEFLNKDKTITDPTTINGLNEVFQKLNSLIYKSDYSVASPNQGENTAKKKLPSLLVKIRNLERNMYLIFLEKTHGTTFIKRARRMAFNMREFKIEKKDFKTEDLSRYLSEEYNSLYSESSPFGYFLNSFGSIKDPTMQIFNDMVRQAKRFANQRTLDYRTEILDLYDQLNTIQNGNNADALSVVRNPVKAYKYYETNDDGSYSGNIIQPVHWGKWEDAFDDFKQQCIKEFNELYKDKPEKINTRYKKAEAWEKFYKPKYLRWHALNSIDHGKDAKVRYTPATGETYEDSSGASITQNNYTNTKYFTELSREERNWIEKFTLLKADIDKLLGREGHTVTHRLPQFRGEFIERLQTALSDYDGSSKAKRSLKTIRELLTEQYSVTSEDADYGSDLHYNSAEEDFLDDTGAGMYGETLNRIPLYGINKLVELEYSLVDVNNNPIVTKKFSTEREAKKYLNEMLDNGEIDSIKDITITHSKKSATHKLSKDPFTSLLTYAAMASNYSAIREVASAAELGRQVYKTRHEKFAEKKMAKAFKAVFDFASWAGFTSYGRYTKYVDKLVYGKYNHFTIGKSSINKAVSVLGGVGSSLMLAGNITVGVKDFAGKLYGILREAHLEEYVSEKAVLKAIGWWTKNMLPHALNYANDKAEDPISLFKLHFNISDIFDYEGKRIEPQKARIRKIIHSIPWLPLNMSSAVECIMYAALAFDTQVRDAHTGEITDMMSRYQITTDPNRPDRNRKEFLQIGTALVDTSDEALESFRNVESVIKKLTALLEVAEKDRDYQAFEASLTAEEKAYLDKYPITIRGNYEKMQSLTIKDRDSRTLSILNENRLVEAKARVIMSTLAGNYNLGDRTSFQDTFLGIASLTMRGWFTGMVAEAGFLSNRYRSTLKQDFEGFFNSNFIFLLDLVTSTKKNPDATQFKVLLKALGSTLPIFARTGKAKEWKEMLLEAGYSEHQYNNISRNTRNWFTIGALQACMMAFEALALATMGGGDDGDDEDKYYTGWARFFGIMHYLTKAIRNEFLGVYNPFLAIRQAMDFTSINKFTPVAGLLRISEVVGLAHLEALEALNNWFNPHDDVWQEVYNEEGNITGMVQTNPGVWKFLLHTDDEDNIEYRNLKEEYIDEDGKVKYRTVYYYDNIPYKVPLYKSEYKKDVDVSNRKAGEAKIKEKLEKLTPFYRHKDVWIDPLKAAENLAVIYEDNKR